MLRIFLAVALLASTGALRSKSENIVYALDFAQPSGPAKGWLEAQGFTTRLSARKLNPHFSDKGLHLETDSEYAGVFEKIVPLPGATRIRIHWGVERYPQGADWENGVNAVPIAVMTSFGTERFDSGAFYLPVTAPYFIGLFMGETEQQNKLYRGRYFKDTGRYYCAVSGAPEGKTIVTELDLTDAFRSAFPDVDVPQLSGFAFQMNTKKTQGGANAFLKKIEFLGE